MQTEMALNGSTLATLERFRAGISVEEIARDRGFTTSTIEGHLARAVESGEKLDRSAVFGPGEEEAIREAFIGHEGIALVPIFEKLGGKIGYGKLKLFRAFEDFGTAREKGPG